MTKDELSKFEEDISQLYKDGKIKAPVHLAGDNEEALIKIFNEQVGKDDWIVSTHRSQYHWLLSGRDPEDLKQQILDGNSQHVFGHKFLTSAIVGGNAPIAVGIALGLKLKGITGVKVVCFLGDMSARTGIAMESMAYASGHDLPILFVIEDNEFSVRANTRETWGKLYRRVISEYGYIRKYNHSGPFLNGDKKYVMF